MCDFDSMVSLGDELDNQAFELVMGCFALFSGVILSIRSFFTIMFENMFETFTHCDMSCSCQQRPDIKFFSTKT